MATPIMIKCPTTGRDVATGIEVAREEYFDTLQASNNKIVGCEACGRDHTWSKADAFLGRPPGEVGAFGQPLS